MQNTRNMPDLTTLDSFLSPPTWEMARKPIHEIQPEDGPVPSLTRRLAGTPCLLDNSSSGTTRSEALYSPSRKTHHHIISNEPTSLTHRQSPFHRRAAAAAAATLHCKIRREKSTGLSGMAPAFRQDLAAAGRDDVSRLCACVVRACK